MNRIGGTELVTDWDGWRAPECSSSDHVCKGFSSQQGAGGVDIIRDYIGKHNTGVNSLT